MVQNIISVCACNFLGVLKNGDKYHFSMTKSTGEMSKVISSQRHTGQIFTRFLFQQILQKKKREPLGNISKYKLFLLWYVLLKQYKFWSGKSRVFAWETPKECLFRSFRVTLFWEVKVALDSAYLEHLKWCQISFQYVHVICLGVLKNGAKYHFCTRKSTGDMSKVISSWGLTFSQFFLFFFILFFYFIYFLACVVYFLVRHFQTYHLALRAI